LRRTSKYASLLRISGALHLGIFEQSEKNDFFSKLLMIRNFKVSEGRPLRSNWARDWGVASLSSFAFYFFPDIFYQSHFIDLLCFREGHGIDKFDPFRKMEYRGLPVFEKR